jgi:hypothetical protein
MLVTDISVIGWLISSSDNASRSTVILAFIGVALLTAAIAIDMETIVAIVAFAVILVIAGIGFDLTRWK